MTSISIKGRVDGDVWANIRGDRTSTEALQSLVMHWQATGGDALTDIAPTPTAAIAVLRHSHNLLSQLMSNSAIALPSAASPPVEETQDNPLTQADEW